jgi:hypothetical protein
VLAASRPLLLLVVLLAGMPLFTGACGGAGAPRPADPPAPTQPEADADADAAEPVGQLLVPLGEEELVERALASMPPELRVLEQTPPSLWEQHSLRDPLPGEAILDQPGATDIWVLDRSVAEQLVRLEMERQRMPAAIIEQTLPLVVDLAQSESNWGTNVVQGRIPGDPNNAYPTRARGIFQYIPATWERYATPEHGNIFNPIDQIAVTVRAMRLAETISCGAERFTYPATGETIRLPLVVPDYGVWCAGAGGWGPGRLRDG